MRTAQLLQQSYDLARGKRGSPISLGEFMLYGDIAEVAKKTRGADSLMNQLAAMAAQGRRKKRGR